MVYLYPVQSVYAKDGPNSIAIGFRGGCFGDSVTPISPGGLRMGLNGTILSARNAFRLEKYRHIALALCPYYRNVIRRRVQIIGGCVFAADVTRVGISLVRLYRTGAYLRHPNIDVVYNRRVYFRMLLSAMLTAQFRIRRHVWSGSLGLSARMTSTQRKIMRYAGLCNACF